MAKYDPHEVQRFKQEIDLARFAIDRYGYQYDKQRSSKNHPVLKGNDGSLGIRKNPKSGDWTYFNAHDQNDHGTILDMVANRENCSINEAKDLIREYTGALDPRSRQEHLEAAARPAAQKRPVADLEREMTQQTRQFKGGRIPYLEEQRGLDRETYNDPRFAKALRTDRYGNAVFPYLKARDPQSGRAHAGYETRGQLPDGKGLKRYQTDAYKGVWVAGGPIKDAEHIVLAEAPIDAMSYAQHIGDVSPEGGTTCYIATGGGVSEEAKAMLSLVAERYPEKPVTIAKDNDKGGQRFEDTMRGIFTQNEISTAAPRSHHKDWNEQIVAQREQRPENDQPADTRPSGILDEIGLGAGGSMIRTATANPRTFQSSGIDDDDPPQPRT